MEPKTQRKPSGRNHSILNPYAQEIATLKYLKGKSYPYILKYLNEKHDIKISISTLYSFIKVREKKLIKRTDLPEVIQKNFFETTRTPQKTEKTVQQTSTGVSDGKDDDTQVKLDFSKMNEMSQEEFAKFVDLVRAREKAKQNQ